MAIFYNVHRIRGGKTIRIIDTETNFRWKDVVLDYDMLCGADEVTDYEEHEDWEDLRSDSGVEISLPEYDSVPEEWEGVETVTTFHIGRYLVVVSDKDWDVIDQTPECFSVSGDGWKEWKEYR